MCIQLSSVQSLSLVQLFQPPWTTAHQASLSITTSGDWTNTCPLSWWCHPTMTSSVVPFSSYLQSFPASGSFQISELFPSSGQITVASASVSVLLMNIQDWFPLWVSVLISLQSKWLSRAFSNTTVQKHQLFSIQLKSWWPNSHINTSFQFSSVFQSYSILCNPMDCSTQGFPVHNQLPEQHPYMDTGKTIALTRWTFVGKVMSLLFNMLSRWVIAFLPKSKHLLILWQQSPSAAIFELP